MKTRLLFSLPCPGCGANVLLHDKTRDITCDRCNTGFKVPHRVVSDLELGRALPFDAERESQAAIDARLESHYRGFELPAKWILLAATASAVFFGWVYPHNLRQADIWDVLLGAAMGFGAVALPLGWTASWLGATGLGEASHRTTHMLTHRPKKCPSCDQDIMMRGMPGRFQCCKCQSKLLITTQLVIVEQGKRPPRFEAAADEALEGQPWLDRRQGTRGQKLGLVAITVAIVSCLYAILAFPG